MIKELFIIVLFIISLSAFKQNLLFDEESKIEGGPSGVV
jgi:hypothetical protein